MCLPTNPSNPFNFSQDNAKGLLATPALNTIQIELDVSKILRVHKLCGKHTFAISGGGSITAAVAPVRAHIVTCNLIVKSWVRVSYLRSTTKKVWVQPLLSRRMFQLAT